MFIQDLKYRQTRQGSEVSMVTDDNEVIALDAEVVVRFRLARGIQISEAQLLEIRRENEILMAKRKLVRYLSLRKKSKKDAALYLKKAGFSEEAIQEAIQKASELSYLDDQDFAESFVRMRSSSGKKGPNYVTKELLAKGLSRDMIKSVVAEMSNPETQLENARRQAAIKYQTLKGEADLIKAARKLTNFLARRGFDPEVCDRVAREFFGDPTQF